MASESDASGSASPARLPPPTLEIHPPEDEQVNDDGEEGDEMDLQTPTAVRASLQDIPLENGDSSQESEESKESLDPSAEEVVHEVEDVPAPPPSLVLERPNETRNIDSPRSTESPAPPEPIQYPRPMSLPSDSIPSPRYSHQSGKPSTSVTAAGGNAVSVVLISSALETIAASKDAKRNPQLKQSAAAALEMLNAGEGGDRPREIFEPLKLACETKNDKLMIASLDCISKLISYSFFQETVAPAQALASGSPPASPTTGAPVVSTSLADIVTNTITSAYTESTPDAVSLQVVKALLALVLSNTVLVHHSSLLKAVRTVYNIFLLSQDPVNQMVAQGGLSQMVNHIFTRAKLTPPSSNGTSDSPAASSGSDLGADIQARLARENVILPRRKNSSQTPSIPSTPDSTSAFKRASLPNLPDTRNGIESSSMASSKLSSSQTAASEPRSSTDTNGTSEEGHEPGTPTAESSNPAEGNSSDTESRLTIDTSASPVTTAVDSQNAPPHTANSVASESHHQITTNDLFVKDAFLVFRALCKLTMKPLNAESERDPKSHAMRSKLLSLQLVLQILDSHLPIFVDPNAIIYSASTDERTLFIQAVKQYLCLSISRNAVSTVSAVFEIAVEIFWRVICGMRTKLKKEIEVLLNEIFIPILEMRNSTLRQKSVLLSMLYRLCQDPQALVEIYLNYDCDKDSMENIYERLMNIISKMGTTHFASQPKQPDPSQPASTSGGTTHDSQHSSKQALGPVFPPSPNVVGTNIQDSVGSAMPGFTDVKLKRQSLECLVVVLKSLVVWGVGTGAGGVASGARNSTVQTSSTGDGESGRKSVDDSDHGGVSSSANSTGSGLNSAHSSTSDLLVDDPGKFETAKQRKTTLLEGIRKFNFKPKKGIQFLIDTGFIPRKDAKSIAKFLMETDGLNKTMIGEYLGEGEEENIATMHAFVDLMDFTEMPFIDALRIFLQSFRLPGEAQKIDRYMLKFAQRYMDGNTNTPFANADAVYVLAYSTILLNTDAYNPQALFKTMMRAQRKGVARSNDRFFSASHSIHVKPMFEVAWMAFLAGISGPLQDTDDIEIVELCLDGFKSAIRIVCVFDLELERNAFVTTLAKFTFLNNLGEMKTKNMEAIKALLDVAVTEGNHLKGSWREVLTCVSQLERMQLISNGLEVPETGRRSGHSKGGPSRLKKMPAEDLANESRSTHITVAADMVFSLSHYLNGTAIVDFVQALSDVSWEEIQSSGLSDHPRLFSLQKLVDISYYNMNRIRIEWSNLWAILGEHFNQVCCHSNPHIAYFALDALRQLAMRFLEKEELAHFKFQKDFLKPFEFTMIHNANPDVRDMILQCLQQMVQLRVQNLRSGWRTMFGVFSAASKVQTERIANSAFEIVTRLNKEHFVEIVRNGSFADMTVCITDFCKVSKYQKISLLAIGMLRGVIPTMLNSPDTGLKSMTTAQPTSVENGNGTVTTPAPPVDDPMIKFWFPVLFSFYDIIMNGEDLEVRRLALDSLFNTLKTYGSTFRVDFWDTVCQELLFPIFAVLRSSQDMSRFTTQEDMSVWLSTTMIQALRNLIDLYTHYFEILERLLDGLLDLLCVCICQENDTLARIGTSCFQQLLENNAQKLSPARWERVVTTFIRLFKTTTPHQLFDETLRMDIDETPTTEPQEESTGTRLVPAPLSPSNNKFNTPQELANNRRKIFKQIIVKCVLQLLLIETTNDLLHNDAVYNTIPPQHLLQLMRVLDHSYQFARSFNADKELRTGLWKVGFMKHLPNLLKQESSSAATLVNVLLRMYYDKRSSHVALRSQIGERLIPLGLGVIQDFNTLRAETQTKNIAAWTPVVAEVLTGFSNFDDQTFSGYLPAIYPLATELLLRDLSPEIREAVRKVFVKVGKTQGLYAGMG
ncbi:guanine nucleotide exchange protein for ADP-robosylation factor [Tulasnella sp. 418]|nr:guanine nucleotide exchange protein for ADP-robosylation factor [Tulasnella sp. 418]